MHKLVRLHVALVYLKHLDPASEQATNVQRTEN